jgi:hypothetical protein
MQFTDEEWKEKVQLHKKWRLGDPTGARLVLPWGADLRDADLQGADLRGAVLQGAVLQDAVLQGAVLQDADLQGADLQGADLRGAVLQGADLRDADLQGADLRGAVLQGAVLQDADLQGAVLRGAVLQDADLQGAVLQGAGSLPHHQLCPEEGAFIAYKKAGNHVLTLLIPEDAKRVSSLIGRKCRASKVQVIKAETVEGHVTDQLEFRSRHDYTFVYRVGETAECTDFNDDIRIECAPGIHFWMSKREAQEW